ncbi:efflux RND transporter permease subunit [Thiothrix subterranea]|uniref:Efflux RND transporter permease subunit n=1 Tax=Thiothrix subterranea TaxID=2735563 RepID=A0AA51R4W5_9GAMM|nr:efflux RND transporter permease subunit [Thiothrix subterranea]MDQ5769525.1 efflux RND transporter permease subunit [Thiothrix subterranea]WML87110.1 efflux RND transporter permease subunit [Thiothrix subterranea]
MYRRLIQNHVLANLTFVLVLFIGFTAYNAMPRQQDPTINFNWISIITALPGASAEDVEKRVTDPLEEAIRGIPDMKFVSSNSRANISSLLVRFEDIDERTFDKRLADLRREIQNAENLLPAEAMDSIVLEITTANAFPSAMIAVQSIADDENLRVQAKNIEKALEQIKGVDRVDPVALDEPELQVRFDTTALESLGLTPGQLAETIRAWFRDLSAGSLDVDKQSWLVRLSGKTSNPQALGELPVPGVQGEVSLSRVASVERARAEATQKVRLDGEPAVLFAVMKEDKANVLDLVERMKTYIDARNQQIGASGVKLVLVDDQTIPTREAIGIMESNALLGFVLVLFVTWLFLGFRIAALTTIGIPFTLAATFWVLSGMGETLNVTVLLGIVIVLGMLVDDAVVVVESIYYRLQHGVDAVTAAVESMREVALPVTTAVLTTIAAFLPLMLLPGILGKFMQVIPMVVTLALAISLIEAFWMLPAHVASMKMRFDKPSRIQQMRNRGTHWLQVKYARLLVKVLRYPRSALSAVMLMFVLAVGIVGAGLIPLNFFAADSLRLFYVNVEMPSSTALDETMQKVQQVEQQVKKHLQPEDARSVVAYAGMMFTETEPLYGARYGQMVVSLKPMSEGSREVKTIIEGMRADVVNVPGAVNIAFLELAGGPPAAKPISVKVRGDNYAEIQGATAALKQILNANPGFKDITDDASPGQMEMTLRLRHDNIRRAGVSPDEVSRSLRLLVDGEVVADMQDQGEKLEVRVKRQEGDLRTVDQLLDFRLPTADGGSVPLRELVEEQKGVSLGNIRHYNFRRAITLEADLVKRPDEPFYECRLQPMFSGAAPDYAQCALDAVQANQILLEGWKPYQAQFPNIDLDFAGQLDDIQESMDAIGMLFLFGIGLMYLILGTQFGSYWQPLLILSTVPMAFTGVVYGLLVTQNPLSLYTLYGVVALAGIAVNSAIVLISAANDRRELGMSVLHATVYAARRRVIPVLITSLTTMAGLFSLATGLGGKSLIWGPVATAIVWGVGFSTVLTLFAIPVLYRVSSRSKLKH